MNKQEDIETNIKEKKQLIERIEKLEIGLMLIVNQLRSLKEIPPSLLDTVERMILKR
jgi:hypothetical protein